MHLLLRSIMSNLNMKITDHKKYQEEQYTKTLNKLENETDRVKQKIYFGFFSSLTLAVFATLWIIIIYYLSMNFTWLGG